VEGQEVELMVARKEPLWLLILAGWTCSFFTFFKFIDVNVSDVYVSWKFQGVVLVLATWNPFLDLTLEFVVCCNVASAALANSIAGGVISQSTLDVASKTCVNKKSILGLSIK
jgi:hypothetical protein